MSVHQTPDGRWFVRFPKGKLPAAPNKTREYYGRGPEGEVKARERNHALGLGRPVADNSPLFIDLARAYMAAKFPGMAAASVTAIKTKFEGVVLPLIGEMKAANITPEILDKYTSARLKQVKKTTVHQDLTYIRAVLRWSVKRRYISINPMEGFDMPHRDNAVISPPTVAEVQALLKAAAPHLHRAILLSYYTGLRAGAVELLGLSWEQVDISGGYIVIISADKGGLRKRIIPILDVKFADILGIWLLEDREEGKKNSEPVVTYKGKQVKSLKTAWSSAKRRAKITRRIRMYDLRHSFATKMLDAGADLKHVSVLLGHKSVQQTADTYQHTSKRLTDDAVSKLPSVFDD